MEWLKATDAPSDIPYPVAFAWFPNIVGLAQRVGGEWQSVNEDGGDFERIADPDLYMILPPLPEQQS